MKNIIALTVGGVIVSAAWHTFSTVSHTINKLVDVTGEEMKVEASLKLLKSELNDIFYGEDPLFGSKTQEV